MNIKKKFRVFLTIIVVAFCIVAAIPVYGYLYRVITGVYAPEGLDEVKLKLLDSISRYQNGEISVIDMSSITPFAWDRLYFFGNYTSSEEISSVVGSSWVYVEACQYNVLALDSSDAYTLLIFTNKNTVVYCLAQPLGKYPFELPRKAGSHLEAYGEPGFSPQEALFIVDEHGYLVLKEKK